MTRKELSAKFGLGLRLVRDIGQGKPPRFVNVYLILPLNFAALLLVTGLFVSCFEKNTDDPMRAYQYWAGEKPDEGIVVINGRYWESAHWSKEYIMYLELKASPLWRAEFIRQNHLKLDTVYTIPDDAPSWFKPIGSYKIWRPSGFDQGSVYLEDTVAGHLFIYDIQL